MKILKYCSKAVLADSRVASSLAALMRSNPGKPVRSQSWNGGMGWRWQKHAGEIQHMVCCVWSRIKTWKFPHPWVPASVQGAKYNCISHHWFNVAGLLRLRTVSPSRFEGKRCFFGFHSDRPSERQLYKFHIEDGSLLRWRGWCRVNWRPCLIDNVSPSLLMFDYH